MKKFLHWIPLAILCLVLVLLLPNHASAASESDLTFTLNADGASYSVTACSTSASGSLTIPATFNGKPVTGIGISAFYNCTSLTSVTILDSVTSISAGAFYGCSSLESITIPFVGGSKKTTYHTYQYPFGYIFGTSRYTGGVATRQDYYGTSILYTVSSTYYIPSSLKSVTVTGGNLLCGAFYNCNSLTSITIPDDVTYIGESAFYNCNSLTSITIPDNVTSIGEDAFYNCDSLTSVTIPDSVTSIGSSAFYGLDSLTDVYITDSNAWCKITFGNTSSNPMYYGDKLHILDANGDEITNLVLDSSVTKIPDYAFYKCTSLTSVTIPDSVTSIGEDAFSSCHKLTSITIPDGVTNIGYHTFFGCISLASITIPDSVTSIGSYAFGSCHKLTSIIIPDSVTSIGDRAFYYCTGLTSVTIGDSVTRIGDSAFSDCPSLTSITIPDSVTSIGKYAFYKCTSLTSVTIPDSVTSIGSDAFCGCTSLTSVTIPDSVTSIGSGAFEDCDSLTSVTIPDSVTSIGNYAFASCSSLTSITIGDGVTSIGSHAFYSCYKLRHLVYIGTKTQWEQISIGSGNSYLTDAPVMHYKATEDSVHYLKNCINAGLFCDLCNDFLTREKAESGEHSYENDTDTYCDDCGYTRSVKGIAIGQYPTKRYYSLLTDELDVTGGTIKVTYSDGSTGEIAITEDMITGFNNRVYGRQSLKITYCDKRAYYTIINQANHTPDKLEVLKNPNQVSYLVNDTALWDGLTLKATYEDVEVEIPVSDVKVDKVDMTTAGIKTVTVRFYDAIATFPIYVHEMQQQTIDSGLYPESKHNYAANSDDTKIFTYPGAGSLVLTFSAQSYMETNCDYIYILDRMGNQIGQYTGSLANVVVTVPGDTVQIRLVSDDSVNKYGYAFSSITTEAITHPGEDFCEICGELKRAAGKIVLPENMSAVNMTIPAGVTIDLNGHILTVDSLASFGQIIDSVGGGGLIVENIEITGNDWLPIQDSTGCYRFYEYEVENLGTKTGTGSAIFGFTLDFEDATAYTTLPASDDVQVTVTLTAGESTQSFAFSKELVAKYVALVEKHPDLRPYMKLNVTGLDFVAEGTIITVTPSITAVSGKIRNIGAPITYTA